MKHKAQALLRSLMAGKKPVTPVFLLLFSVAVLAGGLGMDRWLARPQGFPGEKYVREWKTIDSLTELGRYKEASYKTQSLYLKAKQDENTPQVVKGLIYMFGFRNELEEDAAETFIKDLTREIGEAEGQAPLQALLYSLRGEMFWKYWSKNYWRINSVSPSDAKDDDIKTWSLNRFLEAARNDYMASLQNEKAVQEIPIGYLEDILDTNTEFRPLRPTLFDFLAHRAIAFLNGAKPDLRPARQFSFDDPGYYAPAEKFTQLVPATYDTQSPLFNTIKVYQRLESFHRQKGNEAALVDVTLERLAYVELHNPEPGREYINTLRLLVEQYRGKPESASIKFALAGWYNARADVMSTEKDNNYTYHKEAHDLCGQIVAEFPKSYQAQNATEMMDRIEKFALGIQMEATLQPGKEHLLLLRYSNVPKVHFRLIKIDEDDYLKYVRKRYTGKGGDSLFLDKLASLPPYKTWETALPADPYFHAHTTEVAVPALEKGHYVLLADRRADMKGSTDTRWATFFVSNLAYFFRDLYYPAGMEAQILDRETGKPRTDAEVWVAPTRKGWGTVWAKLKPDANGFVKYIYTGKKYNYFKAKIKTADDELMLTYSSDLLNEKPDEDTLKQTHFFTDRSIYRPGQTLHFKGIHVRSLGPMREVAKNEPLKIYFRAVSGSQTVDSLSLTTNAFGSVSGSFVIPTGMGTGAYRLVQGNWTHEVRVEEYKRPRFEVKLQQPEGMFRINDTIRVKGTAMALSGFGISGARVKYKVQRFGPRQDNGSVPFATGTVRADDDGAFIVAFKAAADHRIKPADEQKYRYAVSVDVTDDAGETRSAAMETTVGYVTLDVWTSLPNTVSKTDSGNWKVAVQNLNGKRLENPVRIKVERLQSEGPFRSRLWATPDVFVMDGAEYKTRFPYDRRESREEVLKHLPAETVLDQTYAKLEKGNFAPDKSAWKTGYYRAEFSTVDNGGKTVTETEYFMLYDEAETAPPIQEIFYCEPLGDKAEPGETVDFYLSSVKELSILYEVWLGGEPLKRELISLKNQQRVIRVPITERYRGGVLVTFSAVYGGRKYDFGYPVRVPYTNKKLDITWETVRDKLVPGNVEEWKMKVTPKTGDRMAAELLVGMYDASLDSYRSRSWDMFLWNNNPTRAQWHTDVEVTDPAAFISKRYSYSRNTFRLPTYEGLNWFYFNPMGRRLAGSSVRKVKLSGGYGWSNRRESSPAYGFISGSGGAYRVSNQDNFGEEDGLGSQEAGNVSLISDRRQYSRANFERGRGDYMGHDLNPDYTYVAEGKERTFRTVAKPNFGGNAAAVTARSNFNETAFFYPDLKTDADGNVIFTFKVPESLTRWKFKAFAHTQQLQTGSFEEEVVAQKDFMVNTFAPRFLRTGDKLVFSAKVTNLTDSEISGKVLLELKDPQTEQSVAARFGLPAPEAPFTAKAGQSVGITWNITIPQGAEMVKYAVKAVSGPLADGEENIIPVLGERILVTESIPIYTTGTEPKTVMLDKLTRTSATRTPYRFTLEFTSNPAWYAIQSLPYLMEYPHECAEQTFARYYANCMAEHIANSDPRIKAVFETWKNQQPDALKSRLEQNPGLKNIFMEETPWVREAKTQTEAQRRLGVLFDLARMKSEKNTTLRKLLLMQKGNGGFPWFKGGEADEYITRHILCGFGKLRKMGVRGMPPQMLTAVRYMDIQMKKGYNALLEEKADLKLDHLDDWAIHYLYTRSFYTQVPMTPGCQKMMAFYTKQAETYGPKKDNYAQAMLALAMHRAGKKENAARLMESLKGRSIQSEELGTYWKGMLQGGYGWNESPVEMMAVLMEAFDEVSADGEAVDNMRRWLLKNKQTGNWPTTKATVDASYALLMRGTGDLFAHPGLEISVDETPLTLPVQKEAGTGYFKMNLADHTGIRSARVRLSQATSGWGAFYHQYFEEVDKITKPETANPLDIDKTLFREVQGPGGRTLEEIKPGTALEPGDRIIARLVLTADRPMQYIHLKDMRASGLEPENVLSIYKKQGTLGYYESTRDAATHFFISYMPRGTFTLEYPMRVTHRGDFAAGIAQIQCMYAPEFTSYTAGKRMLVK